MKYTLIVLAYVAVFLLSSWSHERDIYRQCQINGDSGATMIFTSEIYCSPKDAD